ncbi:MAG: tRNA (guanosine(46)-N7)-methyltransferase TrmB [Acidobacteriota bacterium]
MARKKLKRFAQLPLLPNFRGRDQVGPGGAWVARHFGTERPLILELGCGKGEYALALAARFPDRHVLAVDRKGDRLWCGATAALRQGLDNVVFLRTDALDLTLFLDPGQVETIWLPFPDPLPRRRHAKHRLLSASALEEFRRVLRPGGTVHLKTDDAGLWETTREALAASGGRVVAASSDIYAEAGLDPLVYVSTTFERRHLQQGKRIRYLAFTLDGPGVTGVGGVA